VAGPDISVVVPVHDAMPYLVTCLASVLEQSIGRDRLELVAVDNGSTDGSAALLDLLAACWPGCRVAHQEGSGGPSSPRNRGLDMATGRYVYFLDADDYLGAEALERLLATAEEHDSDLVVCRRKQIRGQKVHIPGTPKARHSGLDTSAFTPWLDDGPITDDVGLQLTVRSDCKHLFRKDRIDRLCLRFADGVHFGEDSMFSASYAEGATIGVLENYCCYYERLREDNGNLTTLLAGTEMHLDAMEHGWQIRTAFEPAWRRPLLARDVALDLTRLTFGDHFARQEASVRRRLVDRARTLLETWLPPPAAARLPALDRLKVELIGRGMEAELNEVARAVAAGEQEKDVIIDGRAYGGYPYFRDAAVGIPDGYYDVTAELAVCHHLSGLSWAGTRLRLTGHAYIEHIDSEAMTTLILRQRRGAGERQIAVQPVPVAGLSEDLGRAHYDYARAGFDVELDLAGLAGGPLSPGHWGVFLAVTAQGVSKEAPLGGSRAPSIDGPVRSPGDIPFSAAFTRHGTLTLEVPGDQASPGGTITHFAQPNASA
jgi:CDP-glycerol glycerophosphotransferase